MCTYVCRSVIGNVGVDLNIYNRAYGTYSQSLSILLAPAKVYFIYSVITIDNIYIYIINTIKYTTQCKLQIYTRMQVYILIYFYLQLSMCRHKGHCS